MRELDCLRGRNSHFRACYAPPALLSRCSQRQRGLAMDPGNGGPGVHWNLLHERGAGSVPLSDLSRASTILLFLFFSVVLLSPLLILLSICFITPQSHGPDFTRLRASLSPAIKSSPSHGLLALPCPSNSGSLSLSHNTQKIHSILISVHTEPLPPSSILSRFVPDEHHSRSEDGR